MNKASRFSIEELTPDHSDWQEFVGRNHPENHQLKLFMRFAVEPMERDEKCVAFVMPLKSLRER